MRDPDHIPLALLAIVQPALTQGRRYALQHAPQAFSATGRYPIQILRPGIDLRLANIAPGHAFPLTKIHFLQPRITHHIGF